MFEKTSVECRHTGRRESAGPTPVFVVLPHAGVFRVCPIGAPEDYVEVFGSPERPQCSCSDFQGSLDTRSYRCPHIEEVFRHLATAIVSEWVKPLRVVPFPGTGQSRNASGAKLHLKRVVRLEDEDSSVEIEFVLPVSAAPNRQTEDLANAFLISQERILNLFRHIRQAPAKDSKRDSDHGNAGGGEVDVQAKEMEQ